MARQYPHGQPSLEDYVQHFMRQIDPSRLASLIIAALVVAVLAGAALTCFFTVQPEEEAVVKRFGKVVDTRGPGLHFKLPFGIDRAWHVPTKRVLKE
jgi:membrane protease subunit HflK